MVPVGEEGGGCGVGWFAAGGEGVVVGGGMVPLLCPGSITTPEAMMMSSSVNT